MEHHKAAINWGERLRASGIHLTISLAIALLAALLVFWVWYPYPYREISGGRQLFLLLVTVDVVLGPLITLAIFNRQKTKRELRLDLALVVLLQLAALGYGMWTVAVARPVHLVFEIDRFRVIHALDVPDELLSQQPAGIDALPWTGPTLLGVRPFRSENEKMEATLIALQGVNLGARPDLWQAYDASRSQVLQAARPVEDLKRRFSQRAADIDRALRTAGQEPKGIVYVPLVGRSEFWTAFVDPVTAQVIAYLPLDPY